MQQNPFDQFDGHSAPAEPIILKPADPSKGLERSILQLRLQKMAREATRAQAEEAAGNIPTGVTGPDLLAKLSRADAIQVKALAEGRMQFPTGMALSKPYWQQKLAEVAQYDPTFDQVDYHSRSKTRADFTSGKSSQNIKALNTAIGHLGHLAEQIDGTASHGGFPLATTVNAIENAYKRSSGDPGITNFEQTAGALAGELTAVYRGAGGAEADIKRYIDQLSGNGSHDQKWGAVQNIAQLLKSRLDAIGDQYTKGMGSAQAPLQVLDPGAKKAFDAMMAGQAPSGGGGASGGTGGSGGGAGGPSGGGGFKPVISGAPQGGLQKIFNSYQGNAERLDQNVAGGDDAFRSQFDPKLSGELNILIRKFKTPDEINAYLKSRGADPVNPADVLSAQNYLRNVNPGYKASVGYATRSVPNTTWERVSGSPLAATSVAATNAAMLGGMDEVGGAASWLTGGDYRATRDRIDAGKTVLQASHPGAYLLGDVAGSVLPFAAPEALIGKGGSVIAKTLADGGVGGVRGFLENNDNRLGGAVGGAFGGAGGSLAGRAAAVPIAGLARTDAATNAVNAARRLLGKEPLPVTPSLSPAERSIYSAATKAGPDDVQGALTEAQGLGVPMSLADTHPELRSLAGAAVRRSPTASRVAEGALLPRSRGQIDRFGQAMERDLGPLGNVPQISSDLTASAKTDAAPLYDRAYAAGQVNDPALNELLKHPEMKSAFDAAKVLRDNDAAIARARGEPEPPPLKEMYTLSNSSPTGYELTTPPDVRTLDYIKRGLDGRIRSAFSGADPQAAMQGPFLKDARNLLLSRTDAAVPDYAAARAAYAGPMQATDALEAGQNAVRPSVTPDQLGVDMKGASPADIPHLQLGYRGGLMDQANRARYNSNPFSATLGTPAGEQKLGAMYPGNPGVERMLRQRDLEEQLARTTNKVLGGSDTAERHIADQTFASDLPQMAVDGALMLAGQAPVATISKKLSGQGLRNAWDATLGKRAVAKADEMAPTLLDTDPAASLAKLQDLLAKGQAFRDAVQASRQRTQSWLAPLGAAAGVQPALQ